MWTDADNKCGHHQDPLNAKSNQWEEKWYNTVVGAASRE